MSNIQEREAFEAWVKSELGSPWPVALDRADAGNYLYLPALNAWKVWQARGAIAAQAPTAQPASAAQEPLHITDLIDWLAARYRAAGGKEGITDLSAFCEEVMRWTETKHGITGSAKC